MVGGILGDMIGGPFEGKARIDPDDIQWSYKGALPTDDTILMCAVAEAIMADASHPDFDGGIRRWATSYPHAGYGSRFRLWMVSPPGTPGDSIGNGSAMRAPPIGWLCRDMADVVRLAEASARPSHDTAAGIRGAVAVAGAVRIAASGGGTADIIAHARGLGYAMDMTVDEIRPGYAFDATCDGSVPQAIRCAVEGGSVRGAIRLVVSIGGDTDTMGCIAGAIAEAMHGLGPGDAERVARAVDRRMATVVSGFGVAVGAPWTGLFQAPA